MKNTSLVESEQVAPPLVLPWWHGLGAWNIYFLAKLALYWGGYINFDLYYNALLLAALLFPLRPLWLHKLRRVVAIPFGVAVLYYDTWFPPFKRLLERPEVFHFSNDYILELLGRFINWELVGLGFIFLVGYLFLSRWLRMTFFSVLGLCLLGLASVPWASLPFFQKSSTSMAAVSIPTLAATEASTSTATPTDNRSLNEILDQELQSFYAAEAKRQVAFESPQSGDLAFDMLFINICSLSWADLKEVNLLNHPLFQTMDVVFDDFNSVTSYSGPAVTRLMYANCGQKTHDGLYEDLEKQCSLFDNLRNLGFETSVALNQTGEFQGFKDTLAKADPASTPLVPDQLKPALRSFYGSPLWNDLEVLNLWLEQNPKTASSKPKALLYNTVTLHDGNREATADGGSRPSPYEKRAETLLQDLDVFLEQLEQQGRKVLVVLIPEHGASLTGDRMQIPGMREIPTPEITHVPVGVRLIGAKAKAPASPIHIAEPSSFLGVSELVARIIKDNAFEEPEINWTALTTDLPQTKHVSENEGVVIMQHEGTPYVRLQGKNWVEYKR